ncbi:MAG: hypothetical protein ACI9WU_002111 [Myxococcota bacterium]|jgi:hypothetical protein
MPRIDDVEVRISTGARGIEGPPVLVFNGHLIPVRVEEGGTGSGEHFVGVARPNSFAHSVQILGPEPGTEAWDIEKMEIVYRAPGEEWTVRWGAVSVDDDANVDIWDEPPLPTWDV